MELSTAAKIKCFAVKPTEHCGDTQNFLLLLFLL